MEQIKTSSKQPLNRPIQLLKVISLLLSYPTSELQKYADELRGIIHDAREIPVTVRKRLLSCLQELTQSDLMDAQEKYGELFERGRRLSLLLFEHVHGESRDRGQAMVDLMAQYETKGLSIGVRELPDYIPLYLEYLGLCDGIEARQGLADVAHILALLSTRLQEKQSLYACCFDALLTISGSSVELDSYKQQVAREQPDDTLEAMDKEWEEEMVTFGGSNVPPQDGCSTSSCYQQQDHRGMQAKQAIPEPVHFTDSPGQTSVDKGA